MKKASSFWLLAFMASIVLVFSFAGISASSEAQIWTEDEQGNIRYDFEPDENVYIRGSGFNPNAQIDISIIRPADNVVENDNVIENYSTSSDENGCFLYIYALDGMVGTYHVTATDGLNSASTDFEDCLRMLEGYDKAASRWERGRLDGWKELDWVPYRIKFRWLPEGTSNYNFIVYHNNLLGDDIGVDKLINFRVGDKKGNPVNGSVTVSGPFYKTPGKSCDRDIYYSLSVTFNTPSRWLSWYVYWDAHLAIGSSGWPGAKLHAYSDITGCQTVPIKVPPVPLGSISGSKWNDLSYDGVWDLGEPGLSGWAIQLHFFDSVENSWINLDNEDTGSGGSYTFSGLVVGNYRLAEVLKENWEQTYPPSPGSHSITLSEGENRSGVNFGNISIIYDVKASISPSYQSGLGGQTLYYIVTVVNKGNVLDIYGLDVSDNAGWGPVLSENSLSIPAGENRTTTLTVTIPENAVGCTEDNIIVSAISLTDNASGEDSCIVHVNLVRDVEVSIVPEYQATEPCNWLEYTVTVANPGNVDEVYGLSVADTLSWDNIWLEDNTLWVASYGGENSTTLHVHIPESAEGSTEDNIIVTAISLIDNTNSAEDSCIAHVAIVRDVDVTISPSYQIKYRGCSSSYTVTVTNTGNFSDTYELTVSDNAGWSPTVDPTSLTIPPGGNQEATLTVVIPTDVEDGTQDNMTVIATSQSDNTVSDSASCVAEARFGAHTDHLNDPTDNWPNDYTPMYIPLNGAGVTISPYITCTIYENCHHSPYYHPCKMAQTILTDNDWSDDNALYEYLFEDWIDFDFNDIEVELSGVTDTVFAEILIEAREAGWKNPFGVEITPEFTVMVKWSSIEFPEEHNLIVDAGETASILLFSESNPGDNASITIYIARDVGVSISPNYQSGLPCSSLEYAVLVSNTGHVNDTFDLTVSDNLGWGDNITFDNNQFENVPPGENRATTLRVHIPDCAEGCTEDNITVTATSQADNTVSAENSCIAHVDVVRSVEVEIAPGYQSGEPCKTLDYTVTVRNTGNVDDVYDLSWVDTEGWGDNVSLDVSSLSVVRCGGENSTTLHVHIPECVEGCTEDNVTVTATSQADNTVSAENSCIAHVDVVRGVEVEVTPGYQSDEPCKTLDYTVTVRNTGNVDDVYDLSWVDTEGWGDNVSLDVSSLSVVRCGGENSTTLHVHIPESAEAGISDNILVIATSQTDNTISVENTCIAHVTVITGVEVLIAPFENNELPKDVIVVNEGNVTDSYSLIVEDNAGWGPELSENLLQNVPPGENQTTKLSLTIPPGTKSGIVSNVTVTATSVENAEVTDNDSAQVTALKGVEVTVSPTEDGGSPGETLIYVATVKNIGTVEDNYLLTAPDELGWLVTENLAILNIPPGRSDSVNFGVIIPENVEPYSEDLITVTAVSLTDPMVSDKAMCIAFGPNLLSGWNLISFPVASENDTPANLFGNVTYEMFYYDLDWGFLPTPSDEPVELGVGYWVKLSGDVWMKTTGEPVENFSIDLVEGWNLIGFPVTSPDSTPDNIFAGVGYEMFYYDREWGFMPPPPDEPVELGLGYWVKVDNGMTITVPL